MKKYELIIFDCDGTLVDSEPITNSLVATMINERGIEMTPAESLDRFAGKTIMDITSFVRQTHPNLDDAAFEEEYRSRCHDLFKRQLQPIEGVHAVLQDVPIAVCVASNGPKVKMKITLPATGLDKYFNDQHVFSAYDIKAWKPDPSLFLHAAREMGVAPEKALVIEDTWSGVKGALNAGIDVWAYNPHSDPRVLLDGVPNYSNMTALGKRLKYYI